MEQDHQKIISLVRDHLKENMGGTKMDETKDEWIRIRISLREKEEYEEALHILSIKSVSSDIRNHIKERIEESIEFKQGNKK